jgi:hypothetical protein
MTGIMASQDIDLSSWDTLCVRCDTKDESRNGGAGEVVHC